MAAEAMTREFGCKCSAITYFAGKSKGAVSGGTLVLCFLGMLLMPVHTIQTMGLAAAITVVYAAP